MSGEALRVVGPDGPYADDRLQIEVPVGEGWAAPVVGDVVAFEPHADDRGEGWGVMRFRAEVLSVVGVTSIPERLRVDLRILDADDERASTIVMHLGRSPLMEQLARVRAGREGL